MPPFRGRKPAFRSYSPPKLDSREGEARAMLSGRRSLDGLEPHGLACCFNLRNATAARLIQAERERRAHG